MSKRPLLHAETHEISCRGVRKFTVAGLLVLALVALTACSGSEGTGGKGYITGDGRVKQFAVADRGEPVELTGEDLDGNPIDLTDYRGKPVVITIWGSWCPPCTAEAPDVVNADEELGDRAQFVGINIKENSPANGRAFEDNYGVQFPSIYSPDSAALFAFPGKLSPKTIPGFAVLDAEGRVAATIIGVLPSTQTLVDLTLDVAKS